MPRTSQIQAFLEDKIKHIPSRTCIDEEKGILYILDEDDSLLGGIGFRLIEGSLIHFRVYMAITQRLHLGQGWWLYLHAIALLSSRNQTLSADSEVVTGFSIEIWEKLYKLSSLTTQALPFDCQQHEYNNEHFEELALTNKTLPESKFQEYGLLDDKEFILAIIENKLTPHLYNLAFKMPHNKELIGKIEHRALSEKERDTLASLFDIGYFSNNPESAWA